jgi:hypothetical protein
MLLGEIPAEFAFDDAEENVPGLGAIFLENLAMHDLQSVGDQVGFILIHDLEFDEHAGFDEFACFFGRKVLFLEPIGDGESATGFE